MLSKENSASSSFMLAAAIWLVVGALLIGLAFRLRSWRTRSSAGS